MVRKRGAQPASQWKIHAKIELEGGKNEKKHNGAEDLNAAEELDFWGEQNNSFRKPTEGRTE